MKLDDSKLSAVLKSIHSGPLAREEAAAIIDVARFAASVDGRMDMGEMATVARLSKIVYAMSGEPEQPVPSTPMAPGWSAEINRRIPNPGPRELAYAATRLIIIADRKITTEETELAAKLMEALRISRERASEIDEMIDTLARTAG